MPMQDDFGLPASTNPRIRPRLRYVYMASIINTLLVEIIEHIIDIVARDDRRDNQYQATYMKACSLTCWRFFPRSRENLFHSIKLHDTYRRSLNESSALVHVFTRLIVERPQIATYVRRLHYVMKNASLGNITPVPCELKRLTNLETLVLQPELGRFQWQGIYSTSRRVLLHLMHLPTITTLKLVSIQSFVLSDILSCPNLQNLHLQHVVIGEESSKPPSQDGLVVHLRKLELSYSSIHAALKLVESDRADGRQLINLAELKDLSVVIANLEDALSAGEIASHIRYLEIARLVVSETHHAADLDIALSTSLETLVVLTVDIFNNRADVDPLLGLDHAFKGMAGRNRIEVLTLRIKIVGQVMCSVGDDWGTLARVLLSPGWSSLKQVYLSIFIPREGVQEPSDLTNLAGTQLRGLSSSKLLDFTFVVGKGNHLTSNMSVFSLP